MSSRRNATLALLLIAPAPTLGVIPFLMGEGTAGTVLWAAAKVWLFTLPALWHLLVDQQPISISRGMNGGLRLGLLTGFLAALGIVGGYFVIGQQFIDPADLRRTLASRGLDRQAVYFAAAAYWVFVNSMLEEYAFRWFIVRKCEALMNARAAIVVSALIFVVHHTVAMAAFFPWWINTIASLAILIAGATWSWLYIRYRSIWVPYLSHAIADIAIFGLGWWLVFGMS